MPDYETDEDYTDAGLLRLWRRCAARISVSGQSYEYDGRVFTAADIKEVEKNIDKYEAKVNAASYPVIGTLLARMKRAT